MTTSVSILDILKAGGLTLGTLAVLSVYSLAVIAQRWKLYSATVSGASLFLSRARKLAKDDNLKEVSGLAQRHKGPASNVVMAALVGPTGKNARRAAAERALEQEIAVLEKGLPVLGTIGSTAPFIGLFGTVLGVMRAFRDLAGAANAGPGVVAVGISEALVATAAGLFVAIPAIVAYNYFTTRANGFADELRWTSDEILEKLTET
jgi:biopolymer transport protein ExbB/biopolymer transport protein TolQ